MKISGTKCRYNFGVIFFKANRVNIFDSVSVIHVKVEKQTRLTLDCKTSRNMLHVTKCERLRALGKARDWTNGHEASSPANEGTRHESGSAWRWKKRGSLEREGDRSRIRVRYRSPRSRTRTIACAKINRSRAQAPKLPGRSCRDFVVRVSSTTRCFCQTKYEIPPASFGSRSKSGNSKKYPRARSQNVK